MEKDLPVGVCRFSHYYEDVKAIRLEFVFGGRTIKNEWPITRFKFSDNMDKDEEMRKTAKLLLGSEWILHEDGRIVLKKGYGKP